MRENKQQSFTIGFLCIVNVTFVIFDLINIISYTFFGVATLNYNKDTSILMLEKVQYTLIFEFALFKRKWTRVLCVSKQCSLLKSNTTSYMVLVKSVLYYCCSWQDKCGHGINEIKNEGSS